MRDVLAMQYRKPRIIDRNIIGGCDGCSYMLKELKRNMYADASSDRGVDCPAIDSCV